MQQSANTLKLERATLIGLQTWQAIGGKTTFRLKEPKPLPPVSVAPDTKKDYLEKIEALAWVREATGQEKPEGSLVRVRPHDGLVRGATALRTIQNPSSSFWGPRVEAAFLHAAVFDEYLTWMLFVDLEPGAVYDLMALDPVECGKRISEVLGELLPPCEGEAVTTASSIPGRDALCLLHLQPAGVASYQTASVDDDEATIRSIVSALHPPEWAPIPHVLWDTLILHGPGLGTAHFNLMSVALRRPAEEKASGLHFSETVLDVAALMTEVEIAEHLNSRLREDPLGRLDLARFFAELRHASPISARYEGDYLAAKRSSIENQLRVGEMWTALRRRKEANYVFLLRGSDLSRMVEAASRHPRGFDLLDSVLRSWDSADAEAERLVQGIQQRQSVLSDYLRDAWGAENARINLSLQITVRRLTWAALFLGAVALVIGLMPEGAKEAVVEWLSSWFSGPPPPTPTAGPHPWM